MARVTKAVTIRNLLGGWAREAEPGSSFGMGGSAMEGPGFGFEASGFGWGVGGMWGIGGRSVLYLERVPMK